MTAKLRTNRKMSNDLDMAIEMVNLTDRKNNDFGYCYTSRTVGEPSARVAGLFILQSLERFG